jgi:hypothetical protein
LIGIAFVAVLAAVAAAFTSFGAPASEGAGETGGGTSPAASSCPDEELRLDAAPEIAPALQRALTALDCDRIIVGAVPPARVLGNLVDRTDVPDLWVPDSSTWLARLGPAGADIAAGVASPSLATSPIVVASSSADPATSWAEAISAPDFLAGDPLADSTAAVPLLGARAEQTDDRAYVGMLVPVAQRHAGASGTVDGTKRLALIADEGGSTAVSEQLALASDSGLALSVPDAGTAFLDYPLVVTALRHRTEAQAAASWLGTALGSAPARKALLDAGFRGSDLAPLEGRGVGTVRALTVNPASVPEVLRLWARLALPTRALAVFDVSGSMGFASGPATRMDLTLAAARAGIGLFPDAAAIGVWKFSQGLDGDRDYLPLLPIRRLDTPTGTGDQRDALVRALGDITFIPGTATALYDTVLAAFRDVQASYDPKSVNSVILFTDGRNEDPGSIGLDELLTELQRLQKPTQPVAVITIGISADADVAALRKISAATGGSSYVARDPRDIAEVFREALTARIS